ncbi:uncharacterized protein LOC117117503 [Anneissia japonica]|uniref:uncharacterized protein LOC117117503 n=1 Tax=Anneissia japonica TaxID=1529436 RepID=UPI0014258946|nr:uncharacterized protein LOC117117503 [Anneissia japonica]
MASNEGLPVSSGLNVKDPKLGLMLSYNHQQKKIVNKIKDRLRRLGYDVWIDSEKMVGPLSPAMEEAVSDAGIVLICLSRKYEESDSCKFECDCILKYDKPFVALIMEDFEIDESSWLKKFEKKNIYVKFTDEGKFEGNFTELTRVLNLTKDKILKAHVRRQQVPAQGLYRISDLSGPNFSCLLRECSLEGLRQFL